MINKRRSTRIVQFDGFRLVVIRENGSVRGYSENNSSIMNVVNDLLRDGGS